MPLPSRYSKPWYEIYHDIAIGLQKFYKKHNVDSGFQLYNLLNQSITYREQNNWLNNITRIDKPSMDPIQLFASFSRSKQNKDVRIRLIKEVWKILYRKNPPFLNIDFDGCPSPMALKLQFVRKYDEQLAIWRCLNQVLKLGNKALTSELWEFAMKWRGIRFPAFTIFLFWINSEKFIPLDNNTYRYLMHLGYLQLKTKISYSSYKELLGYERIKNYAILSEEAYLYYNHPKKFIQQTRNKSKRESKKSEPISFRLIGLRTLEKNWEYHKVLEPNTYFSFDHSFKPIFSSDLIANPDIFLSTPDILSNLYDVKNGLSIKLSAIVGKNGAGKSTLIDLILISLYNLSGQLNLLNEPIIPNLQFELFWYSDKLYKITFKQSIEIFEFVQKQLDNGMVEYRIKSRTSSLKDTIPAFFYSILVNYSHFALNSKEQIVDWITPITDKNDEYKIPLVINPKRIEGNIDVNNEKRLLNMRLLLNLLELHDSDFKKESFRYLDNEKYLKYFSLELDIDKFDKIKIDVLKFIYDDYSVVNTIMGVVNFVFGISPLENDKIPYQLEVETYIVKKVHSIINTYSFYENKYREDFENFINYNVSSRLDITDEESKRALENLIESFLTDIKEDQSHVTFKLKQAVNYLKFPVIHSIINTSIQNGVVIELDNYNLEITQIINSPTGDRFSTAELLPPPIFKLDFHIDDINKSSISKVSSGEYQIVSVISSLLYHIRNIDSVDHDYLFRNIEILLDEIELYFHPNMQRIFIQKLLAAIGKLESNILGIHILLATHSPFILSDIVQNNILKLKNGRPAMTENGYNTFASNIHDLLADEFFLDSGYMGAFAKNKIEVAINLLNYLTEERRIEGLGLNKNTSQLLSEYKKELVKLRFWNDDSDRDLAFEQSFLFGLIQIIGEPVIRDNIENMYNGLFSTNDMDKLAAEKDILNLARQFNINLKNL